jgi:hypothetical protein
MNLDQRGHQRSLREFADRQSRRPARVKVPGAFRAKDLPAGTVYVGRPALGYKGSPYANPHTFGKPCPVCPGVTHDQAAAVDAYREHLRARPDLIADAPAQLGGRDLACWCDIDEPCHADVLLRLAAGGEPAATDDAGEHHGT